MAEYSLPPQLQQGAPDVAQKFLSGVQLGASIGEAKNRLAQSQQQFAVEAQQKQDQITASALKEAQELAVSKAYNDQQISLKQQALEIADKKVGAETIKAARQFQAQQAYQKDFQDLVSTGMSEDDAAKSAMFRNLGMFGTGAGGGAAAMRAVTQRKAAAPTTQMLTDASGRQHTMAYIPGGLSIQDLDKQQGGGMDEWLAKNRITRGQKQQDQQLSDLKGQRKAAQKLVTDAEDAHWNSGKNAAAVQSYNQRVSNLGQINQQIQRLMNAGASAPAPTGTDTANEPDEESDFPGAAPAATDQSEGGPPASLPFKIVQVTGGNGGSRAAAPRKSQDELMSDFLVSHPKTDEELAQTNAPAQVPAALPRITERSGSAPAPTGFDNIKLSKYHTTADNPNDNNMRARNTHIVPRLSAKALLAAAQQLGLTADGKDIYLDDATAGKFRQARSGGLPAALKRTKLENMVLDAANEQQYYVDVNQQ